jgi:hypothetical protein
MRSLASLSARVLESSYRIFHLGQRRGNNGLKINIMIIIIIIIIIIASLSLSHLGFLRLPPPPPPFPLLAVPTGPTSRTWPEKPKVKQGLVHFCLGSDVSAVRPAHQLACAAAHQRSHSQRVGLAPIPRRTFLLILVDTQPR